MPPIDDLLNEIFDGQNPALYAEFEAWVRGSRRFKAFATSYRTKIRAKLKNASGDDGLKNLRAELETAELLLRDERFTLEYETYAAQKTRGPDFTVTFKTHTRFNVEVRRLRSFEQDENTEAQIGKLVAVLCDKVGQMPPSIINVLWLVSEGKISDADLTRAAAALRQHAESKDDAFFTRRGFQSAVDFLKQYRQLSGIVVWQAGESVLWSNALARHKIPPDIITAIQRL